MLKEGQKKKKKKSVTKTFLYVDVQSMHFLTAI